MFNGLPGRDKLIVVVGQGMSPVGRAASGANGPTCCKTSYKSIRPALVDLFPKDIEPDVGSVLMLHQGVR